MGECLSKTSFFKKYLLPGFVFQSVVIAGGYGTGRELVEFFLVHSPLAGLHLLDSIYLYPEDRTQSGLIQRALAVYISQRDMAQLFIKSIEAGDIRDEFGVPFQK